MKYDDWNISEDSAGLWDAIKSGDTRVFDRIFLQYYSPLCEYASKFIPDSDAEEIVQDMMVYLWENREYLFIGQSIKMYLFRSVRNRCFNNIRNGRTRERLHRYMGSRMKTYVDDPDYYMTDKVSEAVEKAINALPEKYRETFLLSRFEGEGKKSYAEIAKIQGISEKTVEYRISQALKLLRVSLSDYLPVLILMVLYALRQKNF